MRKKKLLTLIGSVCLMLVLCALPFMGACAPEEVTQPPPEEEGEAPTPPEPIVLKMVSIMPLEFPDHEVLRQLIDKVKERSNGELVIDFVGATDVIPMYDQVEAVRTGVVDLCISFPSSYYDLLPEAQSLGISPLPLQEEYENGYFDFMVELHENINLRYLGRAILYDDIFYLLTNKRLEKLEDFAGMSFCCATSFLPLFEALGAMGVIMPNQDKYSAMERGLVDGIENPITLSIDLSLYEVSKYVLDQGLFRTDTVFLMNLDKWNSLPKALQDLLAEAVVDAQRDAEPFFDGRISGAKQIMKDEGLEFFSLPPADAKQLHDMAYEVRWEELEEDCSPENYSKLREFLLAK